MNAGITEKAVLYSRSRFSWGLSEIRAAKPDGARLLREAPAAFRRLCVETLPIWVILFCRVQPPSGGCVLKRMRYFWDYCENSQPPSGGCVLKRCNFLNPIYRHLPAAFRRLCVETNSHASEFPEAIPAAFRRLCVETCPPATWRTPPEPAAFRRLCVETSKGSIIGNTSTSRLQAAVC